MLEIKPSRIPWILIQYKKKITLMHYNKNSLNSPNISIFLYLYYVNKIQR